jgi:hypothetical protein
MTVAQRPISLRPDPAARQRAGSDAFVRACIAHCIGVLEPRRDSSLEKMIERYWPGEEGRSAALLTRAAASPAVLPSNALAMSAVADFVSTLAPWSAGAQLLARGLALTFDSNAAIFVPGIQATAAQATFVKEGDPIPVRQLTTAGVTLNPRKLAVICTFTRDVFQHSLPNIEQLVRATLVEAVSAALDAALFDATAGDATRPPGLRNAISATGASALTIDTEAMYDDLGTLIALVAPVAGTSPIAIVASPKQAAAIRLRQPNIAQGYEVFGTSGLAAGIVAVVATNSVASALDPAPRISASIETVLVTDDTAVPAQVGTAGAPPVVGAPARSLYQADLVALKLVLECSWGMRTATGLAWTQSVLW